MRIVVSTFVLLGHWPVSVRAISPVQLQLISASPEPVINQTQAAREGLYGGFEVGRVVLANGTYHAFTHELYKPPPAPGWGWIGIGHWRSKDGSSWTRMDPVRVPHWSPDNKTWLVYTSPMPFFDDSSNHWRLYHAMAPDDHVNDQMPGPDQRWDSQHVQLHVATASISGFEAIDNPATQWIEDNITLVALRGPSSLSISNPWQVPGGKWRVFFQESGLAVTVAESESLLGLYRPLPHVRGGLAGVQYVENPVVTKLRDGRYILVFDYLSAELHEGFSRKIGFLWSTDGASWNMNQLQVVSLAEPTDFFWTNIVRTPLGLIEELDGTLTLFYTGRQQNASATNGVWAECSETKQVWSKMVYHGCFMGMGVAHFRLTASGSGGPQDESPQLV